MTYDISSKPPGEEGREKMYYGIFGLSNEDRVIDYKNASIDKKVYWELNACKGGECLYSIDWSCGFWNGDENLVIECLNNLIKISEPSTSLDVIRKTCGRTYMVFVGGDDRKKKRCNGKWGEIN